MRRSLCVFLSLILIALEAEGAVNLEKDLRRETDRFLSQSDLKHYAPYVGDGFKEAVMGNWEFITDAYNDKAEWSQALSRTGTDIAGYTVTPVLVDGILATSKSQFAVILKEAEVGIFCWDLGREFFSYGKGDIKYDDLQNRLSRATTRELPMMSVKVLAYFIKTSGYSFLSPVVVIAGSFAIQRVHEWYEFQRWKNTVYVDDIRAVLGDELIRDFTIASPETRFNMAEPESRPSLANP